MSIIKMIRTFIISTFPLLLWSQEQHIQTGDSIPGIEINDNACLDNTPGSVRLLGHTPHVPFAIVQKDSILSAGSECCAEWATTQKNWYNLNENGQIVGISEVVGGEGYDATECYELRLTTTQGSAGCGLFTSEHVNWLLDSNQRWIADSHEKQALEDLIISLNNKFLIENDLITSDTLSPGKVFFFKSNLGVSKGQKKDSTVKWAVYGDKYLLVAFLNKNKIWQLTYLDNKNLNEPISYYLPLAVLDINNDRIPEIIYHISSGYSYYDVILKYKNTGLEHSWQVEASSVGGAKI